MPKRQTLKNFFFSQTMEIYDLCEYFQIKASCWLTWYLFKKKFPGGTKKAFLSTETQKYIILDQNVFSIQTKEHVHVRTVQLVYAN